METFQNLQVITCKDNKDWEAWIAEHYTLHEGVWIKMARKSSGIPSITPEGALDVALCYGWIDGQRRSFNEQYFLQKYTPRRPRSLWSKVNINKVEALIAAGKMKEPGLAAIAAAKADGRWDAAYDSQKNATIPTYFASALEKNQKAKTFFESLNKANKYAFLWRLMTAKTPDKRAEQLQRMIELLQADKKLH